MKKSKIDPFRELVGQWPDAAIAAKAKLTISAVRAYRRKHGISAYNAKSASASNVRKPQMAKRAAAVSSQKKPARESRSRVAAFADQLGVLTDTAIAAKAGLTIGAVRAYRVRMGIPSAAENKRKARAATATKAADTNGTVPKTRAANHRNAPTATVNFVWSVRFGDEQTCLVSGVDLASAGVVLGQAGIRDVRSVKRLGKLLE